MKIIPKGQNGLVAKSDNTRVAKPIIAEKIPYKLKPSEFYFIDKRTGKKILGRLKQEVVSPDNRTTYQRKQDQIKAKQVYKKQEEDKNYEKGLETIDALSKLVMPSTYVGPIFNNNGKPYLDNVMSGEGTGSTAGNLAIDLAAPLAISKVSKIAQTVPKTVGQKYVAPYISSKILNRSINANPKGQILVSENYFNSPNNWYRITNTPEVYGIKEMGKNVTTRDSGALIDVPSDNWRVSVLDQPLIRDKEGFLMLDPNRPNGIFNSNKIDQSPRLFQKSGSAHGNTSQASKGQVWSLGTSKSSMFPTVILEGQAARQVPMGITRSRFKLTPWEDIPMGQRIGFHTGEMPLDNLGYFLKLGNGKYSYQGTIIPDKRININTFNSFDLSSSLKNGQWDIPTITQQLKNGTLKAREFLNSETRLSTYAHNKELAKRLGFGNIEEPYNSIARVNKPFQPKLTANNSTEGGSFIPGKQPQQDIIEINLAHQVEPAAFHESLHRGSYGMGSLEGLDDMITFKNTKKFYEYLSDKLRKPWSQQPSSMRDYLDKPGELPVNVLELGQRMGIEVGQKYPGKIQFNTIIDQFKKNNPNDGKLFILDYLNMNKPKRVWNALSGQYFTTLPAIYGGYKVTKE